MKNYQCRFCNYEINKVFVDLGISPLSNSFLKDENVKENKYPLKVFVCENCFLVQLPEFETPKNIFSNYNFYTFCFC